MGLASKKEIVKKYIYENSLDICCLQETEIDNNLNAELLSFPGYAIKVEISDNKQRVAIYVSNRIKYRRRNDLEGSNNHIVVLQKSCKHDSKSKV